MRRPLRFAAFMLMLGMIGCAATERSSVARPTQQDSPDSALRRAAEHAYARAREAMLSEKKLEAGTIWNLRQGLGHRPDPPLARFLDARVKDLEGTRYERLFNPQAPRVELPDELGSGIERMVNASMAPFGRPEQRAIAWITEYATPDASDYTLTHQFLYIEWGESTGLELPAAVLERKQSLLRRVAAEQAASRGFSDLYAERVAILLLYSRPAPSAVAGWIEVIVGKQLENGHWDSQGRDDGLGNYHTTGLCMAALMVYLGDARP